MIGCDRSESLIDICKGKGFQVAMAKRAVLTLKIIILFAFVSLRVLHLTCKQYFYLLFYIKRFLLAMA